MGFYYNRYYGKMLTCKNFGVESEEELVALAKDCVYVNKDKAGLRKSGVTNMPREMLER